MEMTKLVELLSPSREVDNLNSFAKEHSGEKASEHNIAFWRKKVEYRFPGTVEAIDFIEGVKERFKGRVRLAKKTY